MLSFYVPVHLISFCNTLNPLNEHAQSHQSVKLLLLVHPRIILASGLYWVIVTSVTIDLIIDGLLVSGISSFLSSLNFMGTIIKMKLQVKTFPVTLLSVFGL